MANKKDSEKKSNKASLGGDALKASLLEDNTFKKYRNIVKNIKENLDIDKLVEEVLVLHSGRTSRTLHGKQAGADAISTANLQDSSYRSRMAEIRVKIGLKADQLDIALDAARIHLSREYAGYVGDLKTKGERQGFFDIYLNNGITLHKRMKSVCDQIDLIIKDIDQTSHTIRHAIQILELVYSRNNNKQ